MLNPTPEPVAGDTGSLSADLVDRLRRAVPEAFKDGELNLEALAEQIGAASAETGEERYVFSWNGRAAAVANALAPTRATLAPALDAPGSEPTSSNVFIEGDNLEVLKVLGRSYAERFKLTYIDPPYNTGNDFVYRDDASDPLGSYLQTTGQTDSEGDLLVSNTEGHGRFHSRWLSMMYPRLRLARELLRPDGIIVVAIGDDEVHHMRLLLDQVFGPENRVGTMVWEGGKKNNAKFISVGHDYMLVYARDIAELKEADGDWRISKPGVRAIVEEVERLLEAHGSDYEAATEALREYLKPLAKQVTRLAAAAEVVCREYPEVGAAFPDLARPLTELPGVRYNRIDKQGAFRCSDLSCPGGGGHDYTVLHPNGKPVRKPSPGWRYAEDDMKHLIQEERVDFKADETGVPEYKRYLHETEAEVMTSVFYRTRTRATQVLSELMDGELFDFPKDVDILGRLIEATTSGDDLILDFFAGSGSTGEAVFRQNRKDGGARRSVLVQLPEPLNDKTKTGKNSLKAGYTYITEISIERLRRAGAALAREEGGHEGEDLHFRTYRLVEPLHAPFSAQGDGADADAAMEQMALSVEPVADDADPDRLLVEVMLREGFTLTAETQVIDGLPNRVHRVIDRRPGTSSDQMLLVCLDATVSGELAEELPRAVASDAAASVVLVCRDDAVSDTTLANLGLACAERDWKLKTL